MNIDNVNDLKNLKHDIEHKIRVFGVLDSIGCDRTSHFITITKRQLGEPVFKIELHSKNNGSGYMMSLVKWMLFHVADNINVNVNEPFCVDDISLQNDIFIDCECTYKSLSNGKYAIFLTEMTPMPYDPNDPAMRKIKMNSVKYESADEAAMNFTSSMRDGTLSQTQAQAQAQPETQFDDLFSHLEKRPSEDSQSEYESQIASSKRIKVKHEEVSDSDSGPEEWEEALEEVTFEKSTAVNGPLTTMSDLEQFDEFDKEFEYVGFITGMTQIHRELYRYDTVLMGSSQDINSAQGSIEVYGPSGIAIGLYEFKCKTWLRENHINLIEYLIISYDKIETNLYKDDADDADDVEDELVSFDEIDMSRGGEKFIRVVGLCVAMSLEHESRANGYKEMMITDFSVNPNEPCKYFFDRYIDSWETLQLRHDQGIRVKIFNNYFSKLDEDIKRRYDGVSLIEQLKDREYENNTRFGNISRRRIIIEFTLKVKRFNGRLDAIMKGHRILTKLPGNTTRITMSDRVGARAAMIMVHCQEIKNKYSQHASANSQTTMKRYGPDKTLDNLPTTEQFQIRKVVDMLLTYGGTTFLGKSTPPQVEIICLGEVGNPEDTMSNTNANEEADDADGEWVPQPKRLVGLTRLVVHDPTLFFLGDHDVNGRRLKLADSLAKARARTGARVWTEVRRQPLPQKLPQILRAPVANVVADELALQQLLA